MRSFTHTEAQKSAPQASDLIRARLDAFVSAGHDGDALAAELADICADFPDASWEVLAQLDQYHRRGQLSPSIFRIVKGQAETLIFGSGTADHTPELKISSEERKPRREPQPTGGIAPPVLKPGSVLRGRYELEAPLGRGGMSTTFKALDRHRLELPLANRHIAIKVLRDEFSERPEAIVALQDEFGVAQSLSHPNIINVFDLDHDGDLHFITMELVEGESLRQLMDLAGSGVLPRRQALTIIREVGAALSYAHERGVVHGDLTPSNIMIPTLGGVRLLDFGVANRGPSAPAGASAAQPLPVQAPTPAYASPGRQMGLKPDARDDLFSLACIIYELLSGQRPFGEQGADPAHPGRIRPRRIRALNRRQWRTLQHGLAPTRGRRPRTVREFLDGLELHTAIDNAHFQRTTAGGRRRRFWPSLLLTVALGVGVLWFLAFADTTPLREQPWAVMTRGFTHDAVSRIEGSYAAAYRWVAGKLQPSAPHEEAAAVTAEHDGEIEELLLSPAIKVIAKPVAEAPATAPTAVTATVPVVRGAGVLAFAEESFTIGESDTVARLTVRRQRGTDGKISFRWRTAGASARSDDDFVAFDDATESIAAGEQTAVLYVPIMSDALKEFAEHFMVTISDPRGGASLGPVTQATVIIVDDD